ncbi:hypothetical protein ALC57_15693 [Trachymyrmex cornetzi]|uniref:THAP-type domain-containing protein n=1 Tax=Trachymyrmex cornetzi TaxID=471704 RepID=A0A151IWE5_9HYME|nr:hypothetical protein ALC57_15693 [Trachymyrmex cornetzi]
MSICAVRGCQNNYRKMKKMKGKPAVKFFNFPKDAEIAAKWREVCRNEVNGRICSDHFDASCYDKSAQQIALQYSPLRGRKLKVNAIPTINLFAESHVIEGGIQTTNCASTCAEDESNKAVSLDNAPNIDPSASISKSMSENRINIEIEPSMSTAKSKPVASENGNVMLATSTTSSDYLTTM